jgi:hypothetical protein
VLKLFKLIILKILLVVRPGSTIEPGLDRDFTIALQDLIVNQTSLNLVNQGGDIIYSGEIAEFSVTPMAATAEIKAAQNRLNYGGYG